MAMNRPPDAGEILQGTLDMLILRTLVLGPAPWAHHCPGHREHL